MMELILLNKDSTTQIIQFGVVLSTVAIMSLSLSGFTFKKILQFMLSR